MSHLPQWNLSDRLRKVRRDNHLTQEEMAQRIGTKAVTLAAWEEGRNRPKDVVALAQAIEREFDVPAAWTLGVLAGRRAGDGGPFPQTGAIPKQWSPLADQVHQRISA
jgi:transcriptional regulator with XRE-family HTH domain